MCVSHGCSAVISKNRPKSGISVNINCLNRALEGFLIKILIIISYNSDKC